MIKCMFIAGHMFIAYEQGAINVSHITSIFFENGAFTLYLLGRPNNVIRMESKSRDDPVEFLSQCQRAAEEKVMEELQ